MQYIQNRYKKLLFIGDSITYAGHFIAYVEAHFRILYPNLGTEFINLGLPSETASGLSEAKHARGQFPRPSIHDRLSKTLSLIEPDLIISCYGMNDGIFLPFDEDRFKKFKQGIQWVCSTAHEYNTNLLHITPPAYFNEQNREYERVVELHANWLLEKSAKDDWMVLDIFHPLKTRQKQSKFSNINASLYGDGIHPNLLGHKLIASELLGFLDSSIQLDKFPGSLLFEIHQYGEQILKYIQKRQRYLRNAWLSKIGHSRPNLDEGMSIEKALQKSQTIEKKIRFSLARQS